MIYLKLFLALLASGAVSFLLFFVLLKQKNADAVNVVQNKNKDGLKLLKEELKAEQWSWQNVLMSKWIEFGGGFYGVMAVLTYLVVEFNEVIDFLTSEHTVFATLAAITLGNLVEFFVDSIMNFITAITWPVYWIGKTEYFSFWVWFIAVYMGYYLGQMLAKNWQTNHNET